jgi:ribonuclease BN (tRNA processing enzyme)
VGARDWRRERPPSPGASAPRGPSLNLTAREAGQAAAAAGARRLLLSHFWPDNDRQASRVAASAVFGGEILLADEGLEVPLG